MSDAKAILVWNGSEVSAELVCGCGGAAPRHRTTRDLWVGDRLECESCHRVYRVGLTVDCEIATPAEAAAWRERYYGKDRLCQACLGVAWVPQRFGSLMRCSACEGTGLR